MNKLKWLVADIHDTEDLFNFIMGTLLLMGGLSFVVMLWRVALSKWVNA